MRVNIKVSKLTFKQARRLCSQVIFIVAISPVIFSLMAERKRIDTPCLEKDMEKGEAIEIPRSDRDTEKR